MGTQAGPARGGASSHPRTPAGPERGAEPCHDHVVQFLSDEWLVALDAAARAREIPPDDPLADVRVTVEQIVSGGPRWRLVIDHGTLSVTPATGDGDADIRLTSDRTTAVDIAAGRRAALDAFITGDLVIGGDIGVVLEHREALEALGDLFADLRAATTFDDDGS